MKENNSSEELQNNYFKILISVNAHEFVINKN
jgi:hypothetical protein